MTRPPPPPPVQASGQAHRAPSPLPPFSVSRAGADAAVSTGSAKERLPVYSTPEAAFAVEHAPSLLYLHLLFALRDRDLSSIQAEYAPALLAMLALLDDPDTRAALLSDL